MTDSWTWRYVDADGRTCTPAGAPPTPFPSQSDAETWLGEDWRLLLDQGVDAVHLLHDGVEVYGPMGLRPAE